MNHLDRIEGEIMSLEKLKNYLLEGLQDDVHEASQNSDWIEAIEQIAKKARLVSKADSFEELKDVAIEEMLFEEEEWEKFAQKFKEKE